MQIQMAKAHKLNSAFPLKYNLISNCDVNDVKGTGSPDDEIVEMLITKAHQIT